MNEERLIDALSELDDELINAHLEEKAALEGLAAPILRRENPSCLPGMAGIRVWAVLLPPVSARNLHCPSS